MRKHYNLAKIIPIFGLSKFLIPYFCHFFAPIYTFGQFNHPKMSFRPLLVMLSDIYRWHDYVK